MYEERVLKGMTKEKLEQLGDLRAEIIELERQICKLEQREIGTVKDKVRSSYRDFPYIEGSVSIVGYDHKAMERRERLLGEKLRLLRARKLKAQELENEITEYINAISESRIRRIMQYRYVDGLTWAEIGETVNCDRTTAEKIVSRYLDEHL